MLVGINIVSTVSVLKAIFGAKMEIKKKVIINTIRKHGSI